MYCILFKIKFFLKNLVTFELYQKLNYNMNNNNNNKTNK